MARAPSQSAASIFRPEACVTAIVLPEAGGEAEEAAEDDAEEDDEGDDEGEAP